MTDWDAETTTNEVLEGVDLSGKVALVTGATGGLGLETARALASVGAHVVLGARSPAKGEAAMATIHGTLPDADLATGPMDLADLDTIHAFAAWFADNYDKLDLLINNAGVMFTPFGRTAQGFETQFGTNHMGHFHLTALLLPQIHEGFPARVVNVSSAGHTLSDIHWDDPNYETRAYDKFEAYGQSKTANILFSVDLDRRFAPRGIHSNAVHPGMISTDLARHMGEDDMKALVGRSKKSSAAGGGGMPSFKSVEAGAATSVWAATAPELAEVGGKYLADCRISEDHADYALDPEAAGRLWQLSEGLTAG